MHLPLPTFINLLEVAKGRYSFWMENTLELDRFSSFYRVQQSISHGVVVGTYLRTQLSRNTYYYRYIGCTVRRTIW